MKTILVTGGAGFIGSNLVRRALATTRATVVVLDKLTYAGNLANLADVAADPRFAFVKGDIADRPLVDAVIRDYRPDAVVNLAAESHVDRSIDGPRPFVHTNVLGTFELLEASRAYLAEGDDALRRRFRFLHVSTDEVYGSLGEAGLFTEETPYAPNSPYSASKASADHLVRAWHHTFGLPALMTNCSNNYGPYQFPEKLIPLTILNAVEGRDLPIYGDGLYVRDWLYVEDHCDGLLLVLREGAPGGKYNLGGHCERANLEVVDRICDAVEQLVPAASNPALSGRGVASYRDLKKHVEDRAGHDRRYAIDTSKVARELRWAPTHRFETAIVETVRWYLDHRDWCRKVQDDARYGRERLGARER